MHSLWTTIARSARLRTRRETAGIKAETERLCGKIRTTLGATRTALRQQRRYPDLTPLSPDGTREYRAVPHLTWRADARIHAFTVIRAAVA